MLVAFPDRNLRGRPRRSTALLATVLRNGHEHEVQLLVLVALVAPLAVVDAVSFDKKVCAFSEFCESFARIYVFESHSWLSPNAV